MIATQPLVTTGAPGRALLAHVGEALYGPQWQVPLARALRINDRNIRYWLAGGRPMPMGIWPDLATLIEDHIHMLGRHHARIAALLDERRDGK